MIKQSPAEQTFLMLKLDKARKRWRFWALLLGFVVVLGVVSRFDGTNLPTANDQPYVGEVWLDGLLLSHDEQVSTLYEFAQDDLLEALVVRVDSPGGTMPGGLALYEALRAVSAANKPVVVVMGDMAASAGYMVALAGDYILASPATLTGSVGVFLPLVDATSLAEKIGVRSAGVASGSLKMVTSPLEPRTPEAQVYLQDIVDQMNALFLGMVQERRQLAPTVVEQISDGRAVLGQQAQQWGLIDALGDRRTALNWLAQTHGIESPVREIELVTPQSLWRELMTQARAWLNLSQQSQAAFKPAVWGVF